MKNAAKRKITIATRKSPLALWQAETVRSALLQHHPDLEVDLLKLTTQGDIFLAKPLIDIGGKGLFLKELEEAIIDGRADCAVHSMKDVPVSLPDGLALTTIMAREDPRDAIICRAPLTYSTLPSGAHIGTASLRRSSQILQLLPGCHTSPVRGNVQTRLRKLDEGQYDALIMAAAGIKRLELTDRISHLLSTDESLPAVGQGAVGIECREDDQELHQLLAPLHHRPTADCVLAERAMNRVLGGSCHIPVAGHATLDEGQLQLRGMVCSIDGQQRVTAEATDASANAIALGERIGAELLAQGAKAIIDAI